MNNQAEEYDEELDEAEQSEPEAEEIHEEEDEPLESMEDDSGAEADSDDDEFDVVTIGGKAPATDEEDTERAPDWVRDLRKQHREVKRQNKELQDKLTAATGAPKSAELGAKPTLEASDYDAERFETDIAKWYESKRTRDDAEATKTAELDAVNREWSQKMESYHDGKATLKVRDYDSAEEVVQDNLSVTQQGVILQGADNPNLVVYALGKNPKRAKEIGEIKDPVKFAFAVAKLETQLKVTNRKAVSKPEQKISGTARPSGTADSTLERLRVDAEKSGDYTKVFAHKRSKRAK
tara:strand:+ start:1748 stop:2629 length:882 start_codon:yes stop_codon:yes gene_type:complete